MHLFPLGSIVQSKMTKGRRHLPWISTSIKRHMRKRDRLDKQLIQLNPTNACCPDEIPAKLLKLIANEIAPTRSFLFQQSYTSGVVPSQWRRALFTLIHTSGDKSEPPNYRPISLTCICYKVMEHVMPSHISKD